MRHIAYWYKMPCTWLIVVPEGHLCPNLKIDLKNKYAWTLCIQQDTKQSEGFLQMSKWVVVTFAEAAE